MKSLINLKKIIFIFIFSIYLLPHPLMALSFDKSPKCIQIFYDQSTDSKYWLGKTYSIFLQNLLAHFPKYQLIEGTIESYQSGDIERCQASFYLGSYFENNIPKEFFSDFSKTNKKVVWMGYSIWKPGLDYFEKIFGYKYSGLTKLDTDKKDDQGRPTFYKFVTYKGEQFYKWGEFSRDNPNQFMAPFENVILKKSENLELSKNTVLISELIHNGNSDKLPYILQNKNRYYIADIPFSFMHEADRFLIVADLLFDILDEKPLHKQKYGFMRIEDIFPQIEISYVYDVIKILNSEKIKASYSIVPMYVDPFDSLGRGIFNEAGENNVAFVELMKEIKKAGHSYIWHGVTHQWGQHKNPHTGMSSEDFEFWDAVNSTVNPEDSVEWVMNRMEQGLHSMLALGIKPTAWLTPHYQASPLDYLIFGELFKWNVGRVIYYDTKVTGLPLDSSKIEFTSKNSTPESRLSELGKLNVTYSGVWNGQMAPYLIFGDIYGQKIIPENLGNSQPYRSNHVVWPRPIKTILEDAKRNLVLRDVWGSVFYHPTLLAPTYIGGRGMYPGDATDLINTIRGLKSLGYQFITSDDVEKMWGHIPKRSPTIELVTARKTYKIKK